MSRAGSRVVLLGDYGGDGFSTGFDDASRIADLPDGVGVWTDRIDRIAPVWVEQRTAGRNDRPTAEVWATLRQPRQSNEPEHASERRCQGHLRPPQVAEVLRVAQTEALVDQQ
jgi:hypothetical protein